MEGGSSENRSKKRSGVLGGSMVYIASDHRGFEAKQRILERHPEFLDLGPRSLDPDDDYNEFAANLAMNVRDRTNATQAVDPPVFGVIICGSAHGVAIQANRFRGVRAISGLNVDLARLGREHNNANVLCLSADFTAEQEMGEILNVFLTTPCRTEERYARRNIKLDKYGEK